MSSTASPLGLCQLSRGTFRRAEALTARLGRGPVTVAVSVAIAVAIAIPGRPGVVLGENACRSHGPAHGSDV